MKISIDRKKIFFYSWVGVVYILLWVLSNMSKYYDNFFPFLFNNIWRAVYVIVLNFIFFEYTVPIVLRKRKYVLYNVLLAVLCIWLFMMLWSFGLYIWRMIGLGIGV